MSKLELLVMNSAPDGYDDNDTNDDDGAPGSTNPPPIPSEGGFIFGDEVKIETLGTVSVSGATFLNEADIKTAADVNIHLIYPRVDGPWELTLSRVGQHTDASGDLH